MKCEIRNPSPWASEKQTEGSKQPRALPCRSARTESDDDHRGCGPFQGKGQVRRKPRALFGACARCKGLRGASARQFVDGFATTTAETAMGLRTAKAAAAPLRVRWVREPSPRRSGAQLASDLNPEGAHAAANRGAQGPGQIADAQHKAGHQTVQSSRMLCSSFSRACWWHKTRSEVISCLLSSVEGVSSHRCLASRLYRRSDR